VRGWYRQDDFPQNEVLYNQLTRPTYLAWLRSLGVKYVVLTDAPTDYSAKREALLIRSGLSGLKAEFTGAHMTIYSVPKPRRMVTGPAAAEIVELAQTYMTLDLSAPGMYRIAVRYSPYWSAGESAACVRKGEDGMIRLLSPTQGRVTLKFKVKAGRALAAMVGNGPDCALLASP
jgi:hypothetical protein